MNPEPEGDRDYPAELSRMYLLQRWQRKGIGRRLTAVVAERFLDLGFKSMMLWVLAGDPAVNFYEALGGRLVRRRKRIGIGGANIEDLAYGWDDVSSLVMDTR